MNGIHDMGGMQDMGPVQYEKNEPVFHTDWERRVFAMVWATDFPPGFRYQREIIPPAEYLRMSYYEKWLTGFVNLMLKHGMITPSELETGKPVPGTRKGKLLPAAQVPAEIAKGDPSIRNVPVAPRFQTGQRVRALNMNPVTHTRLPRYARGRIGTIERDHGVFDFEDTASQQLGEKLQHVYSVRFAARELWGEEASGHDSVYVDMWDDYLEPA
jgi:nitrile hydratase subunit beta